MPPSVCLSICVCLFAENLTFYYNFHTIQVTMLIFGIQVAFDNTQIVRVISSRSMSNSKVTFLKKMAISGALVFQKHILFFWLQLQCCAVDDQGWYLYRDSRWFLQQYSKCLSATVSLMYQQINLPEIFSIITVCKGSRYPFLGGFVCRILQIFPNLKLRHHLIAIWLI